MRGKFITLEGIDGAGKSTHLQWLAERLRGDGGREVVVTREPGGTPLGEKLRALLLHEPMDIGTETLLMFAARQQHLAQVIRPALEPGRLGAVATASPTRRSPTRAADGACRRPSSRPWRHWVQGDLQPDLTLFFDVPVVVGQGRLHAGQAATWTGSNARPPSFMSGCARPISSAPPATRPESASSTRLSEFQIFVKHLNK